MVIARGMPIPNNWLTFLDLPISGSMSKKEHTDSHILDLVISRDDDNLIISLLTLLYLYWNNLFQLKLFHKEHIKAVDKEAFLADLQVSFLVLDPPNVVDLYDSTLRDSVDQHAPLRKFQEPILPWYNKNIQAVKRHRRYCERLWIRTSLCVHFEMFKVSKILVKNTLASAKSEYYNNKNKA